jgi:hypothetical protein
VVCAPVPPQLAKIHKGHADAAEAAAAEAEGEAGTTSGATEDDETKIKDEEEAGASACARRATPGLGCAARRQRLTRHGTRQPCSPASLHCCRTAHAPLEASRVRLPCHRVHRLGSGSAGFGDVKKRVRTAGGGSTGSVRNLRIREDIAKYLLNLDVNSAHYDPKSRCVVTSLIDYVDCFMSCYAMAACAETAAWLGGAGAGSCACARGCAELCPRGSMAWQRVAQA